MLNTNIIDIKKLDNINDTILYHVTYLANKKQ